MKKTTLQFRLISSFGFLTFLSLALGLFAILKVNNTYQDFCDYRAIARSSNALGQLHAKVISMRIPITRYIYMPAEEDLKKYQERSEKVDEQLKTVHENQRIQTKYGKELNDFEQDLKNFKEGAEKIIATHKNSSNVEEAVKIAKSGFDDAGRDMERLTEGMN